MNAKHTPGPWSTQRHQRASMTESSITVEAACGRQICDMGDYPNDEDKANARLIAAAPDLLARLADMQKLFPDIDNYNYPPETVFSFPWRDIMPIVRDARTAIRKATT